MKISAGWLVAAIAVGFVLLTQLCGSPRPKEEFTRYDYETLLKRIKDTARFYDDIIKEDSTEMANAEAMTKAQRDLLNASQSKLTILQATIERLKAKIQGAKLEPEDQTFVKVSPHYVEGCDSLLEANTSLNHRVDDYEEQSARQEELLRNEIAVRDSALKTQKEFNRKFLNQLDDCMTQIQARATQKQRNQVYAGIGLFGNHINPLAGGQVNVSLRTRNNQIYELTGAAVGNTWYGGVGTKILIKLK